MCLHSAGRAVRRTLHTCAHCAKHPKLKSPAVRSCCRPQCTCCHLFALQVPFLGWVGVRPVQQLLQAVAVPTAGLLFQRTGTQFFLADGTLPQPHPPAGTSNITTIANTTAATNYSTTTTAPQRPAMPMPIQRPSATPLPAAAVALSAPGGAGAALREATEAAAAPARPSPQGSSPPSPAPPSSPAAPPLLYRMTQDDPDRGLYFYSALASFASRTAYANTGMGLGAGGGPRVCAACWPGWLKLATVGYAGGWNYCGQCRARPGRWGAGRDVW